MGTLFGCVDIDIECEDISVYTDIGGRGGNAIY